MNKRLPSLLCLALLPLAAMAQDDQTNAASAASSLGIALDRTQTERIAFLLDVAQSYLNEKDYTSAIDAYERILKIDPQHQQARYIIAHVYINGKQYTKAEKLLSELAKENPEDFKLLNNLSWLYATAEDPAIRDGQKAVKLAQQAMVLAPDDYHVWSTLSEAYYVVGEYEKSYRAINHMASLAARYAQDMTPEMVAEYNEQIRKCKRAVDTAAAMKGDTEE